MDFIVLTFNGILQFHSEQINAFPFVNTPGGVLAFNAFLRDVRNAFLNEIERQRIELHQDFSTDPNILDQINTVSNRVLSEFDTTFQFRS